MSADPASPFDPRKPILAIWRSLAHGFRQHEAASDKAIANTREKAPPPPPRQPEVSVPHIIRRAAAQPRRIGAEGIALIKRFEGCARLRRDGLVEAYPDPGTGGEPWTIGWGATRDGLHGFVGPETVWTQAQCDARLEDDLVRYAAEVARAIGDAPTTQGQFDAMVSFHYNTGAIARATLTRRHCAGDHEGAAAEFRRWNKAGGRVLKGLVRRRLEEERLYRGG
jgi:GH24 family phage-related lysozyme (muramidase)